MPELQVGTTLRGILPHIETNYFKDSSERRRFRWPMQLNMPQILLGKMIVNVERRAKYLLLKTHEGTIIHLGMSGHLRILTNGQPHEA